MGIGHCLTVRIQDESCEVPQAADKTLTQRLLYLSPARKPVNGPRLVDAAKIQKIHYYKHVYFGNNHQSLMTKSCAFAISRHYIYF